MPAIPVKWFHSSFQGAPALTATAGAMISILDACLINGFNTKTIDSITRSGTTATATISGGHGYLQYQVVLIAGADQAEYNGEFRVTGVTSTTFTFEVSGSPVAATGTITVKTAPVGGWTKAYSGTNKAAYKSTDPAATGCLLRLDDTNTVSGWNYNNYSSNVAAYGCESMTDIDTATNKFGDGWWRKSSPPGNTTTPRDWLVVADPLLLFQCSITGDSSNYWSSHVFGDPIPLRPGDVFHCIHIYGNNGASSGSDSYLSQLSNNGYKAFARVYSQLPAGGVAFSMVGSPLTDYFGSDGLSYPNPPDRGIYIQDEILLKESAGVRAKLPGLKQTLHNKPFVHAVILDSLPGRPGGLYLPYTSDRYNSGSGQSQFLFDIKGPWR